MERERERGKQTGARRVVVEELVGIRIDADDAERVAAVLADPSWQIGIHREAPTLIPDVLLLHLIFFFFLNYALLNTQPLYIY